MYGRKPNAEAEAKIKEPKKLLVPIFILAIAIIFLGIYPTVVLNLIDPVIKQFPFMP
jgi:formate hydrogenlyase subunit 3/multisubunit Na+/H+ antiporter MnhD subunit